MTCKNIGFRRAKKGKVAESSLFSMADLSVSGVNGCFLLSTDGKIRDGNTPSNVSPSFSTLSSPESPDSTLLLELISKMSTPYPLK